MMSMRRLAYGAALTALACGMSSAVYAQETASAMHGSITANGTPAFAYAWKRPASRCGACRSIQFSGCVHVCQLRVRLRVRRAGRNLPGRRLLPAPEEHPSARVLIMSAPTSGKKGNFVSHHWVVLKRKDARSWSRYEVLGFSSRDDRGARSGKWFDNQPALNRYAADARWFGRDPVVLAEASGAAAEAMIPKILAVIDNYEAMAGRYRAWPGPNSNTFMAVVLRAVPELGATLPPTAIGKDFRPSPYLGLTDSRTGGEVSLFGLLGLKFGLVEGAEINFLSFVAGIDLRKPALKVPGFGRIDLASGANASVMKAR